MTIPRRLLVIGALGAASCGPRSEDVAFRNPLPGAVELETGGHTIPLTGAETRFSWREGDELHAMWDGGCGRERLSLSVLPAANGAPRTACIDGYACVPDVPDERLVPWIDVSIDNRGGAAAAVSLGSVSIPVAEGALARVQVPASACEAGARVAIGGAAVGLLPFREAVARDAARTGPVTFALVDVKGDRCYRLRSPAAPEGDALVERALHLVPRIDDLFPAAPAPDRWTLSDEPCLRFDDAPAAAAPKGKSKARTATAGVRSTRDPVGDRIDSLTPKVNACVMSSRPGNEWSVRIAAKVVVNLRGQLLDAQVKVSPSSPAATKAADCVTKLIRGAKYPKTDVPITTVEKNWRVQIAN